MKKNTMMRIASTLLIAVLLTTCAIGATFAKYTSEITATGSVTVAKWAFEINDTDPFVNTVTFNFAETWTETDGTTETDVADKKLAPGTKGSFNFVVENLSEVNAQFKIDFDFSAIEDLPLNITYKIGVEDYVGGTLTDIDMGESVTVTVSWEWPFEAVGPNTNANDTTIGKTAGTFDLSATITAVQVD